MTVPYTYLLKHLPTGKVYYGCRFAEGCHPSEFWIRYKTSSKYVKQLINEYGEDTFNFEIRKTFNNTQSCRLWETKVLKRLKVVDREIFLNKTDNCAIQPLLGDNNPAKRPDVRLKLSVNNASKRDDIKMKRRQHLIVNNPAKNDNIKLKIKQAALNRVKLQCQHCGKFSTPGMFSRWHGDNCSVVNKINRNNSVEMNKKHSLTINSEEWKLKHYKVCEQCNKLCDPGNHKQHHGINCKHRLGE